MNSSRLGASILAMATIVCLRSYTSGPSTGYSGAPNESTCTSCHAGSAIGSGTQWNRIRLKTNFTGGGYIPDSTYTFTLSHVESGISTFGFQLTVLDSQYKAAGTFSNLNNRTQTASGTVSGATRYYINHTSTGSSRVATDSTAWTFQWKAPSKNLGALTLYVSLNAANSNGGSSGDRIYTKTFSLPSSSLLPVASASLVDSFACASGFSMKGSATNQASSYLWEQVLSGSTKTLSTQQNPNLQLNAGNYTLRFTARNSKGPSREVDTKITVYANPNKPGTSPKGNQEICEGSQLRLSTLKINTAGFTQQWLPGGQTATLIYVSDSGTYYHEVTSDKGCKTLSDAVRLSLNALPEAQARWADSPAVFCAGQQAGLLSQLKPGDSLSLSGSSGPFLADSLVWINPITGKNSLNILVKSSKKCLSKPQVLSYEGFDSLPAAQLQFIDSSLTELTFAWRQNPQISSWEISTDTGQHWSGIGSDTAYQWNLGQGNRAVLLMVRGQEKGPCQTSRTAYFHGRTKSCQPIPYTWSWTQKPICVGDSAELKLEGLPSSYAASWNGGKFQANPSFGESTTTSQWSLTVSVLDSNQLICGSSDRSISVSLSQLEPSAISIDMPDSLVICQPELNLAYSSWTDSVAALWAICNGQRTALTLGANQSQKIKHDLSTSVYLEAQNRLGCQTQSRSIFLEHQNAPLPMVSSMFAGDSLELKALSLATNHRWLAGSAFEQWLDSNSESTWKFKVSDWPSDSVYYRYGLSLTGQGCTNSMDSILAIPVNSLAALLAHGQMVYPNPVQTGQILSIPDQCQALVWTNSLGQEIAIDTNRPLVAPATPGTYWLSLSHSGQVQRIPVVVLAP